MNYLEGKPFYDCEKSGTYIGSKLGIKFIHYSSNPNYAEPDEDDEVYNYLDCQTNVLSHILNKSWDETFKLQALSSLKLHRIPDGGYVFEDVLKSQNIKYRKIEDPNTSVYRFIVENGFSIARYALVMSGHILYCENNKIYDTYFICADQFGSDTIIQIYIFEDKGRDYEAESEEFDESPYYNIIEW